MKIVSIHGINVSGWGKSAVVTRWAIPVNNLSWAYCVCCLKLASFVQPGWMQYLNNSTRHI